MKWHLNTTLAVISALEQIFHQNKYADKVIEKVLKQNPKWGARDRKFIAETTYNIVRWYRLLQYAANTDENFWHLLAAWCIINNIGLPPWKEFENIQAAEVLKKYREAQYVRKIKESIPDWLDELGERELGELWNEELKSLNEEAAVVLRVNRLKTSKEILKQVLLDENIQTSESANYPDALLLNERSNIFKTTAFKEGLFEVQDASSQLVAPYLDLGPGMRVIDACAGAGGKTLHIAALMQNKGRIIAMDTEAWKLDELLKRARRAGVSNIETKQIIGSKTIKRMGNSADRLLLDVPCSGLGVLRRNPDAKWKLSESFINQVKTLQAELLEQYSKMLKKEGILVYSTCSILPSENENQVKHFLENNPGKFELIAQQSILPSGGFDGFFMARIKKIS
jgi:16S rRNA (cytosine967-C5)-methyltransferase